MKLTTLVLPIWATNILRGLNHRPSFLLEEGFAEELFSSWDIKVLSYLNSADNIEQLTRITGLSGKILCQGTFDSFKWCDLDHREVKLSSDFDTAMTGGVVSIDKVVFEPSILHDPVNDTVILILEAMPCTEKLSGEPLIDQVGRLLFNDGFTIKELFNVDLIKD